MNHITGLYSGKTKYSSATSDLSQPAAQQVATGPILKFLFQAVAAVVQIELLKVQGAQTLTSNTTATPPAKNSDGFEYPINGNEPMRWNFARSSGLLKSKAPVTTGAFWLR